MNLHLGKNSRLILVAFLLLAIRPLAFARDIPILGKAVTELSQVFRSHSSVPTGADSMAALVIGAGPSGSAAALALKKRGYRVLLVEKRTEYSRLNFVVVSQKVVERFEELQPGLGAKLSSALERVNDLKLLVADGQRTRIIRKYKQKDGGTLRHDQSLITINRIEEILNTATSEEPQIEVIRGGKISIALNNKNAENHPYALFLEFSDPAQGPSSIPLREFDLVVAADGASSETRESLLELEGQTKKPKAEKSAADKDRYFIAGRFEVDQAFQNDPKSFTGIYQPKDGGKIGITMVNAKASDRAVALAFEVKPSVWDLAKNNLEVQNSLVRDYLTTYYPEIYERYNLANKHNEIPTNKVAFKVLLNLSPKVVFKNSVVLIGDAVGTGSLVAGEGINTALTLQNRELEKLAHTLTTSRKASAAAFKDYETQLLASVRKWQSDSKKAYKLGYRASWAPGLVGLLSTLAF